MTDLTNSHSLTDFQRNARSFIAGLNASKEPMLLTVNGKVQAVLVDPTSYQQLEAQVERQRFLAALGEGERAIQGGRVRPAEQAHEEMKSKYGF
jgi:PHD/YefM family antitoxin component YafN of YafNO toxin-antitoxin module